MPVWSNDGKSCVPSDRYKILIYIQYLSGGPATRLTYHSSQEYPSAFTNDGKHYRFSSARGDAAATETISNSLYDRAFTRFSVTGGRPTQILTTPAENISFLQGTNDLITTKGGE
jgi:Tol biopolymer transport system component